MEYFNPVCCMLSSLHDPSCLFYSLAAPGIPALVTDSGLDKVTIKAALQGGPDQDGDDSASFAAVSSRPQCMRDPVQGKWALHTLLAHAYERALLHQWPRKGPEGFRNDLIDLFAALSRIKIGNNNRPAQATFFGGVTLIPELFSNAEAMMRRKVEARQRPIIIGRYASHLMSGDGSHVTVSVRGLEGVKLVVSASVWKDRVVSFVDPGTYRSDGFHTLLIFNAAAARDRYPDGAICMKNLAWIHVTEHNIPIESREEGWEIRRFVAQGFHLEKVLQRPRDNETRQELARRDLRIKRTVFGDIEVEIFGMTLHSYVKKIPDRIIETGSPLLCIHYANGRLTRRYWADPERERLHPGGHLPNPNGTLQVAIKAGRPS
jgi:hypothetical protein